MKTMENLLESHSYPGRGIMLGRSADNKYGVIAYFIMGRSENSRNRVFLETEDGIRTQAFDESRMKDPSLIIYHPVRVVSGEDGAVTIVTNGDQTDTIRDYMVRGEHYTAALATREFEPDGPNYTPRISGILYPNGSYMLSILKSLDGDPGCCQRNFFTYDAPKPGMGHFIHTYQENVNPLPSFVGEPRTVAISGDIDGFAERVWQSLNEDNKISLFVRYVNLETGAEETRIFNKNH